MTGCRSIYCSFLAQYQKRGYLSAEGIDDSVSGAMKRIFVDRAILR